MNDLRVRVALSLLSLLIVCTTHVSAQHYAAVFLGSGHHMTVLGVNDSGVSVGRIGLAYSNTAALRWSPTGVVTNLGTLGGTFAEARAINNLGQIVGDSLLAGDSTFHAFRWTPGSGMQDLGTLDGGDSFAYAINKHGVVVGESRSDSIDHAIRWTRRGGMQDLGVLGGFFSRATGINSAGHIVGSATLPDQSLHAFFWTAQHGMTQLDLGPTTLSEAAAINDSDQVVGYYVSPQDGMPHAFLWDPTTGFHDLGGLREFGCFSFAYGINNSGDVVGISYILIADQRRGHSVIWKHGGPIQQLGPLVVPKTRLSRGAMGINASGQIAANGAGAWLLTPQ